MLHCLVPPSTTDLWQTFKWAAALLPACWCLPPSLPPAHSVPAPRPSPRCRGALLAPDGQLKARGSLASLHAKCLILHAKWDLFFIGSSKSWYVSPNTVSCIAPIAQIHRKSGTSPPHHTRTTKDVFIDFGNFYEAEIITNILGCATAYPILIIILLQHLKCYLQSVSERLF